MYIEENVLVYRENPSGTRPGEWLRKYLVTSVDYESKLVFVNNTASNAAKPITMVHVKTYLSQLQISHSHVYDLDRGLNNFAPPEEDLNLATEIIELSSLLAGVTEMAEAIRDEIEN